ncbi:hypothetical protein B0H66DRAFT_626587 [Apodospora peruviana]|uniref:Uncharacterized protein n=1 Tax=Apodospora peruviana TaxID=516989 RepID=A0AAE0I1L8_9PEZI|nr:hypothetical protein B0H66DRAFT_626587 [Apodospora peruviana]
MSSSRSSISASSSSRNSRRETSQLLDEDKSTKSTKSSSSKGGLLRSLFPTTSSSNEAWAKPSTLDVFLPDDRSSSSSSKKQQLVRKKSSKTGESRRRDLGGALMYAAGGGRSGMYHVETIPEEQQAEYHQYIPTYENASEIWSDGETGGRGYYSHDEDGDQQNGGYMPLRGGGGSSFAVSECSSIYSQGLRKPPQFAPKSYEKLAGSRYSADGGDTDIRPASRSSWSSSYHSPAPTPGYTRTRTSANPFDYQVHDDSDDKEEKPAARWSSSYARTPTSANPFDYRAHDDEDAPTPTPTTATTNRYRATYQARVSSDYGSDDEDERTPISTTKAAKHQSRYRKM